MKKLFIILVGTMILVSCSNKQIHYERIPAENQQETLVNDDGIYLKIAVAIPED